jgi:flagellar biosynthesis/type III secretory pathway protein FliH
MSATKFRFETSFDNGVHAAANAAEHAHTQAIEDARSQGETVGFARGHDQALSEIAAQTQNLLSRLCTEMQVLFDALDGVRRQLVADGAVVASAAGAAMGGRLIERLPEARIASLVEDLIHDVIDTPRLVLRVPPVLLDTTRAAVETISQAHGFAGRLIFLGEDSYGPSDVTVEWAHGGLSFSAIDQQQRIQNSAQAFVDSVLGGGDMTTSTEVHA